MTSLCNLVENCNYGDLKDQMILDHIVCNQLKFTQLQKDTNLTLEKENASEKHKAGQE